MKVSVQDRRKAGPVLAMALGLTVFLVGCDKKDEAPAATAPAEAAPAAAPASAPAVVEPTAGTSAVAKTWTPEALEELLAPVALYPDPILSQVLIASTNPQEVLDAGNWLLQNESLKGNALDEAAVKIGFTPPIRALIQFPETVDMLCMEMDWTTELGEAFVADQAGVLDAVQRLRKQAMDVGNLKSSDRMKVETQQQEGKEVVVLSPPKPEVIYVPQYDPQAVYAPPPAAAPAATTTTTTTEKSGHSTASLVTTGLLAFGAGMLVNELFDDDDDHHHNNDYWYPNYGYGGMPYYPPYPYRPSYGGGYYPSNGYQRPPNYQHGFNNNNVVVINNGNNDYWNDRRARQTGYQKPGAYQAKSPITTNNPRRSDLQDLNKRAPRPMPQDARRPSPTTTKDNWKSQGSYAGTKGKDKASARPASVAPAGSGKSNRDVPKKVQGNYAGATQDRARDYERPSAPSQTSRDMQRPQPGAGTKDLPGKKPQGDRGYGAQGQRPQPQADRPQYDRPSPTPQKKDKPQQTQPMNRPAPSSNGGGNKGGGNKGVNQGGQRPSAMDGANRGGNADRQASQRGKQSKGGGGGGGNKKKAR